MRPSVYIRMIVLLVLVLVGWCGDAAWGIRLEHSLDGVTFSVIGDVDVDEVRVSVLQYYGRICIVTTLRGFFSMIPGLLHLCSYYSLRRRYKVDHFKLKTIHLSCSH